MMKNIKKRQVEAKTESSKVYKFNGETLVETSPSMCNSQKRIGANIYRPNTVG